MTKEQLQDRITKLTSERDQVKTTLAAYDGALQEANFWMSELNKTPAKKETK